MILAECTKSQLFMSDFGSGSSTAPTCGPKQMPRFLHLGATSKAPGGVMTSHAMKCTTESQVKCKPSVIFQDEINLVTKVLKSRTLVWLGAPNCDDERLPLSSAAFSRQPRQAWPRAVRDLWATVVVNVKWNDEIRNDLDSCNLWRRHPGTLASFSHPIKQPRPLTSCAVKSCRLAPSELNQNLKETILRHRHGLNIFILPSKSN